MVWLLRIVRHTSKDDGEMIVLFSTTSPDCVVRPWSQSQLFNVFAAEKRGSLTLNQEETRKEVPHSHILETFLRIFGKNFCVDSLRIHVEKKQGDL